MSHAEIEDLYPLSPVQRGLLAHELADPGRGDNLVQFVATVHGRIDGQAFRQAWKTVQARHTCLRSSFVWENVKQPLQVVHRAAPLPYSVVSPTQAGWEEQMLEANWRRGFSLGEAPLFSVALVRRGERLHELVWCYHHLILDGWSSAVVLREVLEEHAALAASRPSRLPPVAPYTHYIEWLRRRDTAGQASFWREALDGWEPAPRPRGRRAVRPAVEQLLLPGDLSGRLHDLLVGERITVGTLTHAVWAAMLGRRRGTRDVVFGSVSSGRPPGIAGIERIVGPLVRTFPARVRLPAGRLDGEWLRGLQRFLQESERGAAGASLGTIAGWAGIDSKDGLFDSILTVENYPAGLWDGSTECELDVGDIRVIESTGYPFCVEAVPGERLVLRLPHDRDEIDAVSVRALLAEAPAALERLLAGAPSTTALRRLPRSPAASPTRPGTLTSRWEQAVRRHPEQVAVEFGRTEVSYAALDAEARRLATALRRRGVGREDRVVLLLERSHRVPAAILGVLMAGGAYVPVEPNVPPAHLEAVVKDCGAKVAVTAPELAERFVRLGVTVVAVDTDGEAGAPPALDLRAPEPDQAAYVLYTSGSSGRPKGIIVTHANVVRLFDATQHWFRFGPDDVWSWLHSYAFDFSVWEIFGALLHDGRLVVTPVWTAQSPAELLAFLEDRRVTVLNQTPTAFRLLAAEQSDSPEADLRLRLVIFGGEPLPFNSVAPWFRRRGGAGPELVNMYGITETTVHVTYRPFDAVDAELIDGNRIGVPIPDLDVYLLSAEGTPVADGEAGEIYVAGAGLARGYLGAPGLTASRFVPNPYRGVPGGRMYRSGDLGRRLPNGDLEFLGRLDRQVKVRAHRIEAGGVEAVLRMHPAVEDAFVAVGDSGGLAAWVTPSRSCAEPVRRLVSCQAQDDGLGLFELPGGAAISYLNRAETEFMSNEVFGSSCYLRHGLELREGDCVFDVGANIGVFALWAHLQAPGTRVYAFEPIADTFRVLDRNLTVHGVPGGAFQCAMGSARGSTNLTRFPHASVLSGSGSQARHGREYVRAFLEHDSGGRLDGPLLEEVLDARLVSEPVTCPVETVSEMMRRLEVDSIDLLKIDVEGDEIKVLDGIDEEHWPRVGQLAIEVHDPRSVAHVAASLRHRGYRVGMDQQANLASTGLHMVYATRGGAPRSQSAGTRPEVWRSPGALGTELKRHVAEHLPPYMVPASLSLVTGFPRTSNGKIDEAALRSLGRRPQPTRPQESFGTPVERVMADIWQRLLKGPRPHRHASFFELGGDSITCVQMLAELRREGYRLTSKQVFELRHLDVLAKAAEPLLEEGKVPIRRTGAVPLTPIQRWFFGLRIPNRNHWNQAVVVELAEPIPAAVLQQALDAVASRNDAFRLRFHHAAGRWHQSYAEATGPVPLTPCRVEDEEQAVAAAHRSLDIERGPMLRAVLVEDEPSRVLLVAHHLVIDALSWGVVLEDLSHAVGALLTNMEVDLPERGATIQQWADWIALHEGTPRRRPPSPSLPRDGRGDERLEGHTGRVVGALSVEETDVVRTQVLRSAAIGPAEVALAAAVFALSRWTGSLRVAIDVEGHGRDITQALDVSRTVGWFTQLRHVMFDVPDTPDPLSLLGTVRRALARERGTIARPEEACAEVSFNYTGTVGLVNAPGGLFRIVDPRIDDLHDPGGERPYLIDIEVAIVNGRLHSTWSYCEQVHQRATVEALVADYLAALRVLGLRVRYVDESDLTPLDFPLADLSSAELDRLLQIDPDPEDVYVLTPGQQGILFHALADPASDVYMNQFHWAFRGPFDVRAFRQGWTIAVGRHPMLRSSFAYEGLRVPHQLVHRQAQPELELHDWRTMDRDDWEPRWRALLLEHRKRPFDPARGLMRLVLARTGEHEHRFLWDHHHLLFDGWCTGIILRDVFAAYEALVGGGEVEEALAPHPRPYRDYVEWRQAQDVSTAEAFWRAHLAELPPARLLSHTAETGAGAEGTDVVVRRDPGDAVRGGLAHLHRATGITSNTATVGAWALVLAEVLGAPDVLFGSIVSGRTIDLESAESIVGLLINTLPVRVRVDLEAVVVDWLTDLQGRLVEARQYEHVSLLEVTRWCGLRDGGPLFDTAVVFENLPKDSVVRRTPPGLVISEIGSFVRNHFTFTIRAVPGSDVGFEALYNPDAMSPARAAELLEVFVGRLTALVSHPDDPVSAVCSKIDHVFSAAPMQHGGAR